MGIQNGKNATEKNSDQNGYGDSRSAKLLALFSTTHNHHYSRDRQQSTQSQRENLVIKKKVAHRIKICLSTKKEVGIDKKKKRGNWTIFRLKKWRKG